MSDTIEKEKPMETNAVACHVFFPTYLIYRDGRVVSLIHRRPRSLTPIRRGKYLGFTLLDFAGRHHHIYHHRLVAEVFHGACPHGQETRHLDGNRKNNHADNLAWGTRSLNMQDKERHGTALIGERHNMAKLTEKHVRVMRRLYRSGIQTGALMRYFGVSRMTIWRTVNYKLWRHVS